MNNRVFYDWVPKHLDVWLLLFLSTILALTQGVSSTISAYVVGSQSAIPADISMAGFAFYSGMACVLPLNVRLQQYIGKKHILSLSFLILIFLNFILSITDQPLVMVMVSFAMGFIKMMATLLIVLNLIPILMPRGERYQLYCIYYPLSMIFSPVSGYIASYFSETLNWELSFHVQNFFLLLGLIVIMLFVHGSQQKKVPLYQYDWLGTILLASCMLLTSYCLTYGLTENWFASVHIQMAAIGAIITFMLFILRSFQIKRPLFRPVALSYKKALIGLFVMVLLCLYFNTSAIITPLLTIVLKNNPLESARVNTYVVPGYIAGSLIAFFYYRKYTDFKIMAAFATLTFLASNILFYFLTSTNAASADFFLPMFLRAVATIITYISVGIYITSNIPFRFFNDVVTVLILLRSLAAPLIASSLLSNWLYRGQLKYLHRLAENMDSLNPLVAARGTAVLTSVKAQASLLAIRDIYGVLIITCFVFLLFILIFPFHGSKKRSIFNWTNPVFGKEVAQTIPI